jgi:chromate reductase
MKVFAIPGSLRRGSHNRRLLEAAATVAPPGMQVSVGDLAGVPPFDEDLEPGPGAVAALRAEVRGADGLLIATPEYNQSFPGVLKNAIDWLSRPAPDEPLDGKPVALLGATPGRWGTRLAQAGLRQVLAATGARVLPAPMLFIAGAAEAPPPVEPLRALLVAFAAWIAQNEVLRP